jgi:N-acetylmuramoyl-L-alanine amidase
VARHTSGHASAAYEESSGAIPSISRLVVVISCLAAIGAMFYGLLSSPQSAETAQETTFPKSTRVPNPPSNPAAAVESAATTLPYNGTPLSASPYVGIVAGHWGYDTGAICPDGLREVDVNFEIAGQVVNLLNTRGYQAELLEEYDDLLHGYQADALVSIHADSCTEFVDADPPATGFKVASVVDSIVPEEEAKLVDCLVNRYQKRTGLAFHANSITSDMRYYGNFYLIDGYTPAAIIETGFMFADRKILTERPDLVAQGIVDGIVCFIEGETP